VIKRVIAPHRVPLVGDASVLRVLPRGGKGVGPFIFLDHMGPWPIAPGSTSFDIAQHPHIGLSTLTYLFDGEIEHRDSLGTVQRIRPGEVNWMTAGRGVVHSERTSRIEARAPFALHGLQAWVVLPEALEGSDPSFQHAAREALPEWTHAGVRHRLLVGSFAGRQSPVRGHSRLFYVHLEAAADARFSFNPDGQESALYLLEGTVSVEGTAHVGPTLLVFEPGRPVEAKALTDTRAMLLGGDPLGPRQLEWNFVSSSRATIEQAKADWSAQRFPRVPGETEWIPLP
jgi:redox-sensitive bicupin YhaK (pirin superfamily)